LTRFFLASGAHVLKYAPLRSEKNHANCHTGANDALTKRTKQKHLNHETSSKDVEVCQENRADSRPNPSDSL
jgi:hypothetical protein